MIFIPNDINQDHIDIHSDVCHETPLLKTGIKLPTKVNSGKCPTNILKQIRTVRKCHRMSPGSIPYVSKVLLS